VTLPDERYRAVRNTAEFLQRLAGGGYPRVPRAVRAEAYALLRHYPTLWDLDQIERSAPHVMQQRMEPLHRMVAAYDPEVNQPHRRED
jgi:hypothetical protein